MLKSISALLGFIALTLVVWNGPSVAHAEDYPCYNWVVIAATNDMFYDSAGYHNMARNYIWGCDSPGSQYLFKSEGETSTTAPNGYWRLRVDGCLYWQLNWQSNMGCWQSFSDYQTYLTYAAWNTDRWVGETGNIARSNVYHHWYDSNTGYNTYYDYTWPYAQLP